MNNSFIVESYYEQPENNPNKESQLINSKEKYVVITGLRSNRNFNKFIAQFINPEIESVQAKLDKEHDLVTIYRLQGILDGLRKFKDLERHEKFYQNKVVRLTKELNIDGKEE